MNEQEQKLPKLTDQMAEEISACMNGRASAATVKIVVRGYYNAMTPDNEARNREILHHYERLKAIEQYHAANCDEERREYIKKAQRGLIEHPMQFAELQPEGGAR